MIFTTKKQLLKEIKARNKQLKLGENKMNKCIICNRPVNTALTDLNKDWKFCTDCYVELENPILRAQLKAKEKGGRE